MLELEDYDNAEVALRGALSLLHGFGPASVTLAELLIVKKKYFEAIGVIDEALVARNFGPAFSGEGKLYQLKGIAMSLLGNCQEANINFSEAMRYPDVPLLRCEE